MSQGMRRAPAARRVLLALLAFTIGLSPAAWAWAADGPAPLPDDRLGIRTAPLLLLSRADVRADVGLDATQAADSERALAELYHQAAALRGKRGPEARVTQRAVDDAAKLWLETKLSDAQRKRLIEIDLQWEGPAALVSRPVLADHLHLTTDQRTRLAEAIAECSRRRSAGEDGPACVRALFLQARSLLTAEQLDRWKSMLGAPFSPRLAAATSPVTATR
jgi:hypothetical protein